MESPPIERKTKKFINWIVVLVLILFSLVGGTFGFRSYLAKLGEPADLLRSIYRTLQLFTLENGDLEEPIPWILQAVRFAAPLTAIMAIVMAILEIFSEQWRKIRISGLRDHVVIIGLGTKGKNVLAEQILKKEKILVVENDPLNPHLESLKQKRCHLILGDAGNGDILKRIRASQAKSIYLLMGDDAIQVKSCLFIYKLIKRGHRSRENPVKCFMHLLKLEYLNTLKSHNLVENINDGMDLHVFNVYENSARELFQNHPPDGTGISKESRQFVQIIIFGFGQAGEALALQTAFTSHYLNHEITLPRVVIFDREAEKKKLEFLQRYPDFTAHCNLEAIIFEASSPLLVTEVSKLLEAKDSLNTVVLCFDNKTNNMLVGLQIDSIKLGAAIHPFQVFIRTDDNDAFDGFSKEIKPYGLPSRVCAEEVITGGDLDRMAMANHKIYLHNRKTKNDFGTRPADVPWEELPQEYKDSNRKAADHIGVKIRGLGYMISPVYEETDKADPHTQVTLQAEEIELLAQLEHVRWSAERRLSGWSHNPERNDNMKRSPYLVAWGELDEGTKDYDKDSVENIPKVLGEVKRRIVSVPDDTN
jgi:hypothetical protein